MTNYPVPSALRRALDDLATHITQATGISAFTDPDKMTPVTGLSVVIEASSVEWRHGAACDKHPARVEITAYLFAAGDERRQVRGLLDALFPVAYAIREAGWNGIRSAVPGTSSTDIPQYRITASKGITP